ncbi:hypothetical protein DCC85_10950 [Paenibacillus sp. CAA11]|uniref:VOC family protein n=1 Tax=Paenibacillus sp. CAA11 TaxID=1532905 RepID=UPI000D343099|nr:VOC family protein [Paenibacillus sp. CAA11]AWB44684.1 hypothetical protein DCC85_10950 [Paenibacillus sp. CAA11]
MSIRLNPYLNFDGNTKEAVYFYEKALGGKLMGIMTFGDMPADPNFPMTDDMKERVMHANLKIGDSEIMFSDTFPGQPAQPGNAIQIAIHFTEESRAKEVFAALEDGGQVIMPLQTTEWSPLYGIVKDKYGITFQVNVSVQ